MNTCIMRMAIIMPNIHNKSSRGFSLSSSIRRVRSALSTRFENIEIINKIIKSARTMVIVNATLLSPISKNWLNMNTII